MSPRRKITLSVLAAAMAGLAALFLFADEVAVRVPVAEIQGRINALLPIEGSKMGVAYRVVRADTELRSDGRIGITLSASATAMRSTAGAVFAGSGRIAYRDGAFFLADFQTEGVRDVIVGVDGRDRALAGSTGSSAGGSRIHPWRGKRIFCSFDAR